MVGYRYIYTGLCETDNKCIKYVIEKLEEMGMISSEESIIDIILNTDIENITLTFLEDLYENQQLLLENRLKHLEDIVYIIKRIISKNSDWLLDVQYLSEGKLIIKEDYKHIFIGMNHAHIHTNN